MEDLIQVAYANIDYAHLFFFGLLLLAGLNIPLSEDIIVITGGALSSTLSPLPWPTFYFWLFLGCWISAWEAYWIGRLFGPKLYSIPWFKHVVNEKRVEKLHKIYDKFGIFTFLIGRFIPGGVRNALFMSSGLGKMPFNLFLLRDTPACLLSSSFLFYLGYSFGENYQDVALFFKRFSTTFLWVIPFLLAIIFFVYWRKKSKLLIK